MSPARTERAVGLLSRLWLGARLGRLRTFGLVLIAAGIVAMAAATLGGGPPQQWLGDLCFEPRLTVAPPGEVLFHAAYQGLLVTIVALLGETPSMPEVTGLALVTAGMLTAIVPRPNDGGH